MNAQNSMGYIGALLNSELKLLHLSYLVNYTFTNTIYSNKEKGTYLIKSCICESNSCMLFSSRGVYASMEPNRTAISNYIFQ